MHLNSPSEAFDFKEQDVFSTANVLAAADVDLIPEICEEVDGLVFMDRIFSKVFNKCRVAEYMINS